MLLKTPTADNWTVRHRELKQCCGSSAGMCEAKWTWIEYACYCL